MGMMKGRERMVRKRRRNESLYRFRAWERMTVWALGQDRGSSNGKLESGNWFRLVHVSPTAKCAWL